MCSERKAKQLNPTIFAQKFENIVHQYPTRFSKHGFYEPNRKREFLKFAMSSRVPTLWNKILSVSVKGLATLIQGKS